ncbi:MopE-related protein, partial [Thalassobellus citreus]|uniref:MopE-related protein n=1 Tax=Thalassobellus citreus TaxID=3367752 RepID=UPI003794EFCE
ACSVPTGYVPDNTDCDDTNATVYPNAPELCDGLDNNCDGQIDEGVMITFYADTDGDGYGDASNTVQACAAPTGYVPDNTDCDDANATVYSNAPELCDGLDNNCDGQIDEGVKTTFYADTDSDGFGDASNTVQACTAPTGYVPDNTDCDDTNANLNPNAIEVCDGIDNNCDGQIDEGVITTFYADTDGDGFGGAATNIQACSAPAGYVPNNTDCDDTNANINPNATEICDGIDNNCDGQIDEGVTTTYYADTDGDGFGDSLSSTQACSLPIGYVTNDTDCNDANATVYPGAPELCDGLDNNCDGIIPEPQVQDLIDQTVFTSFTFPTINGSNLSGNEAYYTESLGVGTVYYAGDSISFEDFTSYPITFYIYDSESSGCTSEENFMLTIILPLPCTSLNNPLQGATDVLNDTDLSWDAVLDATGYTITVGTGPGRTDIVNALDVGDVLSYNLPKNLPYRTEIYVSIVPYNNVQIAMGCAEESFTTERPQTPPQFFTPNNDGSNDNWVVPNRLNNISSITIYDRYGKLIKEVGDLQSGWDGTYKNKPLPTSDYWYLILYNDGRTLKGHFTLKR